MEWLAILLLLVLAFLAATGRLDSVWSVITTGSTS